MNSRSPVTLLLYVVLGVTIPLVGMKIAGSVRAASPDRPSARAEVAAIDTITWKAGEKFLPARVAVRNTGSRRLVAKLTDPDCRCTIKTKTLRIEPGEEKEFNFYLYGEALRTSTGFPVVMRTNDTKNTSIPLTIPVEGTEGNLGISGTESVLEIQDQASAE